MLTNSNKLLGQTLGTCTLKRLIGRGGMGAVYLAQQSRPRRIVAVKVLLPNLIELRPREEFLARFRREADAIAALDHINIMPIYEYGEQGETAYLVMPYVTGGTLRERLQAQPVLPIQDSVSIIEQAAAGLDSAHALGIIHRDLKPGNILFHADGRTLIADFGLAKILKDATEPESGDGALTSAGSIVGTPEYLSPEQGTGSPIDYHTDVYSLGVVLYQMLAGRVPFIGTTPVAVAIKHAIEEPPLITRFNPTIPNSIQAVVMKALAKAPEQRFSSAGELARALRLAASNESATTIWKAPDTSIPSITTIPTTDSAQPALPAQEPLEQEEASPLTESAATATNNNENATNTAHADVTDDRVSLELEATRITQSSPEDTALQEKVAALPTLMIQAEDDDFHASLTEEASRIGTQKDKLQAFPTLLTQTDATEEHELERKVFYQEMNLPTSPPETERPSASTTHFNDRAEQRMQHQFTPVAANNVGKTGTPNKTLPPTRRTHSRFQPIWMMLIGSLVTLLLIGGGLAAYLHVLPTRSALSTAQSNKGAKTVIAHNVTATSSSQQTPEATTPPTATAPRAAIAAGALIYGTPYPFDTCDQQGGHWTASDAHVTCSTDGSQMSNTSGHLAVINLDKLAGDQMSWPGQNFIVQVQVNINANSSGAFGIDFQPQTSDNSQEYFAYMLNASGQWTFNHYDAQGDVMDSLVSEQLPPPFSISTTTKLTIDIRVTGTDYAFFINGTDTTGSAETGPQYISKIVGLAVDTNTNVTFSNFAIYALS